MTIRKKLLSKLKELNPWISLRNTEGATFVYQIEETARNPPIEILVSPSSYRWKVLVREPGKPEKMTVFCPRRRLVRNILDYTDTFVGPFYGCPPRVH